MKVHVCCPSDDPADQAMTQKVRELGHEPVQSGQDADVVLVIVTMNNYRAAMNWIPVLWDVKPGTPVVFIEGDYPSRISGSLDVDCSPDHLRETLKRLVVE